MVVNFEHLKFSSLLYKASEKILNSQNIFFVAFNDLINFLFQFKIRRTQIITQKPKIHTLTELIQSESSNFNEIVKSAAAFSPTKNASCSRAKFHAELLCKTLFMPFSVLHSNFITPGKKQLHHPYIHRQLSLKLYESGCAAAAGGRVGLRICLDAALCWRRVRKCHSPSLPLAHSVYNANEFT